MKWDKEDNLKETVVKKVKVYKFSGTIGSKKVNIHLRIPK